MSVKLEEEELQQLYQDAHQSQGRLLRGGDRAMHLRAMQYAIAQCVIAPGTLTWAELGYWADHYSDGNPTLMRPEQEGVAVHDLHP